MDKTQSQQPATDDEQLAQAIIGDNNQQQTDSTTGLQFEETGILPAPATNDTAIDTAATDTAAPVVDSTQFTPPTAAAPEATPPLPPTPVAAPTATTSAGGDLDTLKKDALEELRPLVDKLELPSDEKFDIMLLIIRSTDDQSLLSPAHQAAKGIEDDQKRAQALLDIVKEIDYFANQKK